MKAAAIENIPRYALPAGEASPLALRDAPTKDLEVYVERSTTDLVPRVDRSAASEIATYVHDRQIPNEVLIAGITSLERIIIATCVAGVLTCLIVCATVLIAGYCKTIPLPRAARNDFQAALASNINVMSPVAYKWSTNDNPSYQGGTYFPTRSIGGVEFAHHETFQPTADCGLHCQLASKIPEGVWTHTGNATFNGHMHQIHHFRNGSTMGIRAYQKNGAVSGTLKKRDPYDQEDYESVVGDYYWNYGTGAAYDSFHSTTDEINSAGNHVGTYMANNNYIAACVDFEDSTGLLDDGVISVGWNDQPYIWNSQSALDSQISTCNIGNLLRGGIVPGATEVDSL